MLTYFAYGSNMLTQRLRKRTPSCQSVGLAYLPGHALRWHKRSNEDGSGKCDALQMPTDSDVLWGVLFEIPEAEKERLDRAEAVEHGYIEKAVRVVAGDRSVTAFTYVADPDWIDSSLQPFTWYRDLVLAGAQEHSLPTECLESISAQPANSDPDPSREAKKRRLLRRPSRGA